MDLQDFDGETMYFDEQLPEDVNNLVEMASELYADGNAEVPLLKAFFLAPQSLSVLVALYRFYYYQHQYQNALIAAHSAMKIVANKLSLPVGWQEMNINTLGYGIMQSMTLVRFYLLALKGAGYLNLRLGNIDTGIEMLKKVIELDAEDRLGAAALLQTVKEYERQHADEIGELSVAS